MQLLKWLRLIIDIMGINEIRCPVNGQCIVDYHKVDYSVNENNKHIYRVTLIVSRGMQDYIIHFIIVSERIILI